MTARTRLWILVVSTPVIAFALVGGYMGQAVGRDETFQHLRMFSDVVDLVVDNYVEEVDVKQAMRGAMRGLADGLDADSAYLNADLVKAMESNQTPGPADIGVEVRRQYYLRVISAREGSPAAKAGLRTGDYIRAIDGRATRDMSAFEGSRLLSGAAGSKVELLVLRGNAADPHEVTLIRERRPAVNVTSRMANPTTGYVRIPEFTAETPARLKQTFDALAKTGAAKYIVDLRSTVLGDLDHGIATARLFVKSGTLTVRQTKTAREKPKENVAALATEGAITAPVILLVDQGTAGAAELFAAALDGNKRTELVGERTLGRAARQQLVKLPDGSGLLISNIVYLTPSSEAIHEKGLTPDVPVDVADVEFGAQPPPGDPILDAALTRLAAVEKKAA
jgi:carboxyl-terminal processing protease